VTDFDDPIDVDPNEPTPLADDLGDKQVAASDQDRVVPVDGDDPGSIDEALRKHHEAHGA
jgi:hypothetical protein